MTTVFENLIPPPREIVPRPGACVAPYRLKIVHSGSAAAAAPEAMDLAATILEPWMMRTGGRLLTLALRLGKPAGGRGIPATLLAQAYELTVGAKSTLVATGASGFTFGLQTLRQILEDADAAGSLANARIRDWPRIGSRGIHVDLAREMEYRPAWLRRVVENLAYFKMNTLHLYLENKFVFPSAPDVAAPGSMTPHEARDLCRYARRFGITIIPQISTMGHMEHLLNGQYAEMREDPRNSYNLCPTHPRTRLFLAGLIADIAAAFEPPFIHVGYDESHSGVCERCRAHGSPQQNLAEHLNWLNAEVKKHGARTMIYGDKFLSREEFPRADAANGGTTAEAHAALKLVDRDILITDWHYTAPHAGTTRYLIREGFEVHAAPATNMYWHDSIPLHRGHYWITETLDHAIAAGVTGAFNTNWEYYRGQFLDNYWFFEGLAAERMWSAKPHDYVAWGRRFAARFWGVGEDYYSDLAGLAEVVTTSRRRSFLDSDVLAVDTPGLSQVILDFKEIGEAIIEKAQRFRAAARRNGDTLRILDIHGQIIRYIGVRALQRVLLDQALRRRDRAAAIRGVKAIRAVAREVGARLEEGYHVYGGAGQDRKRLARHIAALNAYLGAIRRAPARALPSLTPDEYLLTMQAAQPDPENFLTVYKASACLPAPRDIRQVKLPPRNPSFSRTPYVPPEHLADIRQFHDGRDGLIYIRGTIRLSRAGRGQLLYGADGPVKVWVNGKEVGCAPNATNPAVADSYSGPADWKKGINEVLFALHTNRGQAWGVIARWKMEP